MFVILCVTSVRDLHLRTGPTLLLGDISLLKKAYLYKYEELEILSCSVYYLYIYKEN